MQRLMFSKVNEKLDAVIIIIAAQTYHLHRRNGDRPDIKWSLFTTSCSKIIRPSEWWSCGTFQPPNATRLRAGVNKAERYVLRLSSAGFECTTTIPSRQGRFSVFAGGRLPASESSLYGSSVSPFLSGGGESRLAHERTDAKTPPLMAMPATRDFRRGLTDSKRFVVYALKAAASRTPGRASGSEPPEVGTPCFTAGGVCGIMGETNPGRGRGKEICNG